MTRLAGACLILLVLTSATSLAAENVWSVAAFNARKAEWDQLIGATIHLEGRVSLAGGGQLRLQKFELPIHASDTQTRSIAARKPVEISGRLQRENGKLILEADRIQVAPTDLERFSSKSSRFRNATAQEWTELGDWARERAEFYEDAELDKKAQSAYEQAISIEWKGLAADDAPARFELAKKAAQYKVPAQRQLELKHEGLRISVSQLARRKESRSANWLQLAQQILAELPGSGERPAGDPGDLAARYEKEPLHVYFEADEAVRRKLHRILYVTVLQQAIESDAAADGRNGDAIARRLDAELPELASRAESYRDQHMQWRLAHADTATRPEIEQLVADARARRQPDVARAALSRWFQEREPRLREDGAVGLLQLADEYLALQQDERKAVQLLVEANKRDPAFGEVLERLRTLGYSYIGGTWTKSAGAPPAAVEPMIPQSPAALQVGMTATAARGAMGGNPANRARAITRNKITEVWTFGARGSTRLILRLESESLSTELKVTEIQNER